METKTILVCFRQGTEADRQLERDLAKELESYGVEPYFLYRTTMKAILEYLHSPSGFSCRYLLLSRSVLSEDGTIVDLTESDLMELTDTRSMHIAMVLPGSAYGDTDFLISLYVNGIHGAVFGSGKKGPLAKDVARCLMEGRTKKQAREAYGIGVMPISLTCLTYETYFESCLYLEKSLPMAEKLKVLYQKLGVSRMVAFLSRLPDPVMGHLAEDEDFLLFLEQLKKDGVVLTGNRGLFKRSTVPGKDRTLLEAETGPCGESYAAASDDPQGLLPPGEKSPVFYKLFGFLFEDVCDTDLYEKALMEEDEGPAFFRNEVAEEPEEELSYEERMERLAEKFLST